MSRTGRPPYPAPTLEGNLRAFCTLLRTEYGFAVGPGQTALVLRAVEAVGPDRPGRFYVALQTVLCQDVSQFAAFERAYERFFFPGPHATRQDAQPPVTAGIGDPPPEALAAPPPDARPADDGAKRDRSPEPGDRAPDSDEGDPEQGGSSQAMHAPEAPDDDAPPPERPMRAVASARSEAAAGPDLTALALDPMRLAARTFLRHLHLGRTRRWQAAVRGQRLDLRRTLRASLSSGGEPLGLRWKAPPRRSPRLVLLLDASRSMQTHAEVTLAFGAALLSLWRRTHIYSFSTELQDLTPALDRPPGVLRLPGARTGANGVGMNGGRVTGAWGGGTRIGASLGQFLREHADRVLTPDTLVIIASDGLDVGDVAELAANMAELRRRSAGVLWLNPLAEHPDYRPVARGMQAALPHLSALTYAGTPEQFAALRLPR